MTPLNHFFTYIMYHEEKKKLNVRERKRKNKRTTQVNELVSIHLKAILPDISFILMDSSDKDYMKTR